MDNQNNNVIKPSSENLNNGEVQTPSTQEVKPQKKKLNPLIIVIALVVVGAIVVMFFFSGKSGTVNKKQNNKKDETIKFETEYEWANKYGEYLNSYFENLDKLDIAFVELTGDDIPELVLQYKDNTDNEAMEVLYLKNGDVSKTRTYNNARLYLITPVNVENVLWYIYIGTSDYGKYTILAQLIDGTALDATIKATNNDEVNKFKSDYIHSDYDLTYYEIEKKTFKEDYLTKVDRYEKDNEKTLEKINNLKETRNKYIIDNKIDVNATGTIQLNNYTLQVGVYEGVIHKADETEEKDTLEIKSLNSLVYKGKELTFSIAGNTLTCSDGTVFTADGNNQMTIMDPDIGPITYKIPKVEDATDEDNKDEEKVESSN